MKDAMHRSMETQVRTHKIGDGRAIAFARGGKADRPGT